MKVNVDLILIKGKSILLQLRDANPRIPWPGYWNIPGGSIEVGETAESAIKRELIEETGYVLRNPIHFKKYFHTDSWGKSLTRYVFYEYYDGVQPIKCFEGEKIEFISPSKFKKLKIIPHDLDTLQDAVKTLF